MDAALANGIGTVLSMILNFIKLIIIVSVVMSWVSADPSNQIVQLINRISEPLLSPVRRLTSRLPGPIDWSPFALFLIIIFLEQSIVKYLLSYGRFIG